MEKHKIHIKFEFTNDWGYTTVLEREMDDYWNKNELSTLASEMKYFLLACGYSQKQADSYILTDD